MGTLTQFKPTRMPFLKVSFDRTLHEEAVPMATTGCEVPGAARWRSCSNLEEGEDPRSWRELVFSQKDSHHLDPTGISISTLWSCLT